MAWTRFSRGLAAMLAIGFAAGCVTFRPPNDDIPPRPATAIFPSLPATPALQVLVLGDWGTGGPGQREVAGAIALTHGASPPDLVLTVGDNFYPHGVAGLGDPLWESVFGSVYTGSFWDQLVFFPTLGNHDYEGNPGAQVGYTELDPRWEMPDFEYAFRRSLSSGDSVLFLALDTNPLDEDQEEGAVQLAWADSILDASRDAWVVAYGHHPLASGGRHEASGSLEDALYPLLGGRTAIYLAGHNHSTELLELDAGILQGVCGAGGGLDNPYRVGVTPQTLSAFTNGGWCFLKIWPDLLAVELYDRGGGLQFRRLVPKEEEGG